MNCPAFILGNSPRLPVGDLDCLAGLFTIGVNRILGTGFTPTVILWVDRSVYVDCGEQIDGSDSLLVCDSHLTQRYLHVGLKLFAGDDSLGRKPKPDELHASGNTGTCAARWAVGLGCKPVYILGMEARYKGDKTDFYGVNEHHHGEGKTLGVMSSELNRLLHDCGDVVQPISGGKMLKIIAASYQQNDQEALRKSVKSSIAGG